MSSESMSDAFKAELMRVIGKARMEGIDDFCRCFEMAVLSSASNSKVCFGVKDVLELIHSAHATVVKVSEECPFVPKGGAS